MWKRLNNSRYKQLLDILPKNFTIDFIGPAVLLIILAVFLLPIIALFLKNYTNGIFTGCLIGAAVIIVVLIISGIISSRKNKEISDHIKSANHAEYTSAILQKKLNTTDSIVSARKVPFYIIASVGSKNIKVHCGKDVFINCTVGDSIFIIDFAGKNAENPKTCMAVQSVDPPELRYTPEKLGEEKYNEIYNRTNGKIAEIYEDTNIIPDAIVHAPRVSQSDIDYFIPKERSVIFKFSAIVVLIVILMVSCIVLSFGPEPISIITKIIAGLFAVPSIIVLIVCIYNIVQHSTYIKLVRSHRAYIRQLDFLEVSYVKDTTKKDSPKMYFYRLRADNGQIMKIIAYRNYHLKEGCRIVAYFFDDYAPIIFRI